jgi:predicted GIY-YIG superfamily endonuclease
MAAYNILSRLSNIFSTIPGLSTSEYKNTFSNFHFVYGVINLESKVYVGITPDAWRRINQYNEVKGESSTGPSTCWITFFITCFTAKKDAVNMVVDIHNDFARFKKQNEGSIRKAFTQINADFDPYKIELIPMLTDPNVIFPPIERK